MAKHKCHNSSLLSPPPLSLQKCNNLTQHLDNERVCLAIVDKFPAVYLFVYNVYVLNDTSS